MKLAISNIAWARTEEEAAAKLLQELGVGGVEVAPTKVFDQPLEHEETEWRTYRSGWEAQGIRIVGMQSLLFGRPDLALFQSPEKRAETIEYMTKIIERAGWLGARALVFGSPKNRQAAGRSKTEAMQTAIEFFGTLGESAAANGVVLCVEPNPADYGCDFIRTTEEGIELVREVGSAGFGLHLDAAALTMNGEEIERAIEQALPYLQHFHASEPNLQRVGNGQVDHDRISRALKTAGYDRWVSIEMREGLGGPNLSNVSDSIRYAADAYF